MTITALPPAPSRANDASNFSSKSDALLGALPVFVTETNAAILVINDAVDDVATAMAAGLANAANNATTATTQAGIATDKAGIATTQAGIATDKAAEAAASVASIAGGPVASVNGRTGVVTGIQDSLVSGTNIKTINGGSVLGAGNIVVGGGPWVFLSSVNASNSATVDIETTFDSTYDTYIIVANGMKGQNGGTSSIFCRLKIGGSYQTSGYTYSTNYAVASTGQAKITLAANLLNGTSDSANIVMTIFNPSSGSLSKMVFAEIIMVNGGVLSNTNAHGTQSSISALTGVRFYLETGNIVSGSFTLYGIKKS